MNKLFGTDGIRGKYGEKPVTVEMTARLGRAVIKYFSKQEKSPQVVVGLDTRESGQLLEKALVEGIISGGGEVIRLGVVPTPAVAYITKETEAIAGVMITASHNPYQDNGLKVFASDGYKLPDEIEAEIEKLILADEYVVMGEKIAGGPTDHAKKYSEFVESSLQGSLKGLKVALDCANGAAYQIAPQIFRNLGAEIVTIGDQPDGRNINDDCGSQSLGGLQKITQEKNCDIGIAFDGDADRVIVCDEKGNELTGDHILALGAFDLLEREKLTGKTIVVTQYSNLGLDALMKSRGIKVVRVQNGDRYVIEEMRKKGYILGGERTGHIIFSKLATTGDGIVAGLQMAFLLKKREQPLSELAEVLQEFPQSVVSVEVVQKVDMENLPETQAEIKKVEQKLGDKGRVLARYSGTEKKARVLIEGQDEQVVEKLASKIAQIWQDEIGG